MKPIKKHVVTLAALALTANAQAYCPLYQTEIVLPMFGNATLAMNAEIVAMDTALSGLLKLQNEQLLGAIKVVTKQKSISAHQAADTERKSQQQLAEAVNIINSQDQIMKARIEYGSEFGQGYNACLISEERNELANATGSIDKEVAEAVRSIVGGAGKYVKDYTVGKDSILQDIKANYCTEDMVKSGLCENVGKYAGMATNAAIFFADDKENAVSKSSARTMFINTIVGTPDAIVTKSAAKSAASQDYILAKTQKDALMSPALAALQYLSASNSPARSSETAPSASSMSLYKNQVNRYFGGSEENKKWNAVLAAQVERGLLVEQLKMKALDLSLSAQQYKQYELMESQLAALVAIEVKRSSGKTAKDSAGNALSEKIRGQE